MTAEHGAKHAVRAVPGSGSTAHAARIAVCHVLTLPEGPKRELWRLKLADAEAALLDGKPAPRPGLTDVGIMSALLADS
jgi:hypothetical protein